MISLSRDKWKINSHFYLILKNIFSCLGFLLRQYFLIKKLFFAVCGRFFLKNVVVIKKNNLKNFNLLKKVL